MVRLKHLAICFFIVVFVSVFPVLRNSAQVPEVAFHFTMDEISGDETMDVNGMVGILENGPVVVAGRHGNAIQFTRSDEQAIEIFPDPATNFGTGDLSLEAWVKTPFDEEQSYIFNKWGPWEAPDTPCCRGYRLTIEPGGQLDTIFNDGVPDEERLANEGFVRGGDTSVADGEWHHVVVTRKDTSIIQFWIDGVLDHEIGEAAAAGSIDNTTNLYLGRSHKNRGWFDGLIDEVRAWRGALNETQIAQAMSGAAVTAVEPVGKLPLIWGQIKADH
jgi:hypothetical protein